MKMLPLEVFAAVEEALGPTLVQKYQEFELEHGDVITAVRRTGDAAKMYTANIQELNASNAPTYAAIVSMLDNLDPALMPVERDDELLLLKARESLRAVVEAWKGTPNVHNHLSMRAMTNASLNPMCALWHTLKRCPQRPSKRGSDELRFVKPAAYRQTLLEDLNEVETALRSSAWKGATVLAGSLMEALLCNIIQKQSTTKLTQARNVVRPLVKCVDNSSDPLRWDLQGYVKMAEELKLIDASTAQLALVGKDFRNLVHPGAALRRQIEPSRGTAHAAFGALYRVIEALSK